MHLPAPCSTRHAASSPPPAGAGAAAACVAPGAPPVAARVPDGLLDLLPADVSPALQQGYSCLVDAFKLNERVAGTTLAAYIEMPRSLA